MAVLDGGDASLHDLEEVRGELLVGMISMIWRSSRRRRRRSRREALRAAEEARAEAEAEAVRLAQQRQVSQHH